MNKIEKILGTGVITGGMCVLGGAITGYKDASIFGFGEAMGGLLGFINYYTVLTNMNKGKDNPELKSGDKK
jgi:hypothetical protein